MSGAIRRRYFEMRTSVGRRTSRNFSDSGTSNASAAMMSGPMPPITNVPRQPNASRITGARKPALNAPIGVATFISPMTNERLATGAYSEVSAAQLGIPAPSAMPVARRQNVNSPGDVASAVAHVSRPTQAIVITSMVRRPKRSPSGPSNPEPAVMPMTTAESAKPKLDGGNDQACDSDGTASAITWMS